MIFRKKITQTKQISKPPRRMDGIVTYASLRNSQSKNLPEKKQIVRIKKEKKDRKKISEHLKMIWRVFRLRPMVLKRAISLLLIFLIVGTAFFQNSQNAIGATYYWNQSAWSGGQTSNTAVHPGNQSGWNQYASKDSFIQTTNGDTNVVTTSIPSSSVQTSDTGAFDTHNSGGFNAGTNFQTKVKGAGSDARVDLGLAGISSISSGSAHTLAIRNDNTVWAWGDNNYAQLGDGTGVSRLTPVRVVNPSGVGYLSNIEIVSAGSTHSLALDFNGTVWAWGSNDAGQLGDGTNNVQTVPVKVKNAAGDGDLTGIISIASGNRYSLALKSDGTVWAWGANENGQLGDSTNNNSNLPVQVSGISSISSIASGSDSTTSLAIAYDGSVWSWGGGILGQLGNGASLNSNIPVKVSNILGVSSVMGSLNHVVALKDDGTVWTWGANDFGQLGDGTNNSSNIPVQVLNLSGISNIYSGTNHVLAIKKSDKSVWTWGNNNKGQLGDNTVINRSTPILVANLPGSNNVMLSAGLSFSLSLKSDGTVWAWGININGQLGDNTITETHIPTQTWGEAKGFLTDFIAISDGYSHTLGLKSDGTVWAWGSNNSGQLGDGTNFSRLTPVQVFGLTGVTSISAGKGHSFAIKNDGSVWAWGDNFYGQLGDGSEGNLRSKPVQVKSSSAIGDYLTNVTSISAGDGHSLVIKSDGTAWSWGANDRGQLGIGITNRNKIYPQQVVNPSDMSGFLTGVTSISAGGYHSLASLSDGTVSAWGANDEGQLGDYSKIDRNIPVKVVDTSQTPMTGVNKVSAGYAHSIALKSDGSLMSWGWNVYGQLGTGNTNSATVALVVVGAGTSDVTSVQAAGTSSILLKSDGTVWSWGSGNHTPNQIKDSTGTADLINISAVSMGNFHSTVISSVGNVILNWGNNNNGQLGQNNLQNSTYPAAVWGGTSGLFNIGKTYYFSSGLFTSTVVDSESYKILNTVEYSLTTTPETSIIINIRAGNSTDTNDASWTAWMNNISSGADISSLGNKRYFQYSVDLTSSNVDITPSFKDITFKYTYYPSGYLESSQYNASDPTSVLSKIQWVEDVVPGQNDVEFQVRTAPDNGSGAPGAWTPWCGPDNGVAGSCSTTTYFTDNTGGQNVDDIFKDGIGDQWIQYRAHLVTDGLSTPTLSGVTVQYVVNAPPEIQNVVSSQGSDGIVSVNYEARDPDTNSGTNTPGKVAISLQYCSANCGVSGSEVWSNASTVTGDVGSGINVEQDNWRPYQLQWNAKADYPEVYNGTNFKVRVKANDAEGANNLGYGKSGNFTFDTKNPSNVKFSIDHSNNKLVIAAPNDNSSYDVYVSSDMATMFDPGNKTALNQSSTYPNNYSYAYLNGNLDPTTVHVGVKDAHGNTTSVMETTPKINKDGIVFYDISNKATSEYRELIAWEKPKLFELGSGFQQYNIWRSVGDELNYSIIKSITDLNVNYFLDQDVLGGTTYYYKITAQDVDDNISEYSKSVSDVPDGEGGANALPPVITSVDVPNVSITPNSATITWNTDALSNSTVGYSTTPGDFSNEVGNATFVRNGHNVTITGLNQDTVYHFRVKSVGANNGIGLNDNFDVTGNHDGFTFRTSASDITPPVISNINANPGIFSASISWDTNEAATSFIEYSTTNNFTTGSSYGSYDFVSSHSVTLPSVLNASTIYYYKIHSKDAAGNEAVSSQKTFTTLAAGDTTPPVISGVSADSTHNSATMTWQTDESANSYVEYGTTSAYGKTFGNSALISGPPYNHSVVLPNDLIPETTYYYVVHSTDGSNNESVSPEYNFTTKVDPKDILPPTLSSGPNVPSISSTSATITWLTNENSTSYVDYSTSSGTFLLTQGSATLGQLHSVTLVNLNPETQYFYRIRSADASGNMLTVDNSGNGFTFTTNSGQPPVLQGVPLATKNSYNSYTITWNTDINATSFVEFGTASDFSNASVFGKYDSVKSHSVSLQGLNPNQLYYYRVRSASQFEMVSGSYSFATDIIPPVPVISNVQAPSGTLSYNTATITWTTDIASDSYVDYGTDMSYGKTFGSSALTTSHSINLPHDLSPSTLYHFRINSTGITNNKASTVIDYTFTTLAAPIPAVPIISSVNSVASYNTATITWTTDILSDSYVDYGISTSYGKTFGSSNLTTSHTINLPLDLISSTPYHYQVRSADASNNKSSAGDFTFTTSGTPVPGTPLITNVVVSKTSNNATITWTTDIASDSFVDYGLTGSYGKTFGSPSLVTTHSVVLPSDLTPNTIYHFSVRSADVGHNQSNTADSTFTTNSLVIPQISSVFSTPTYNNATITWTTTIASDSYVEYGTTTSYGRIFGNSNLVTSHSLALPQDLLASTAYHFRVHSMDAFGNKSNNLNDYTFTTLIDPQFNHAPIGSISNIVTAAGKNSAGVTFVTDQEAKCTIEYRQASQSYPGSIVAEVNYGKNHSIQLNGLAGITDYAYKISCQDNLSNVLAYPTVPEQSFTTNQLPVITNENATGVTSNSATITWTTDVPANSYVEFGLDTTYGRMYGFGNDAVTSHSVSLPQDLVPNMTYHYRVHSADKSGNKAVSSIDHTFTTAIGADTIPPSINNVVVSNITDNGATISWGTGENTDTVVYVGETINYDMIFGNNAASEQSHSVDISGLNASTIYHYQVIAKDGTGNVTYSIDNIFTTADLFNAPIIKNIKAAVQSNSKIQTTYNDVVISWDTVEPNIKDANGDDVPALGDSTVYIYDDQSRTNLIRIISYSSDSVSSHRVIVDELELNKTYYYEVDTMRSNSLVSVTSDGNDFKTSAPTPITNTSINDIVITPTSNIGKVTFNTDQPSKCFTEYRADGQDYSGAVVDQINEQDFTVFHNIQMLGLISNSKYFFKISCIDLLGTTPRFDNEYSFTTSQSNGESSDKIAPKISNEKVGTLTGENATFNWDTDKKASSYVRYGLTTTYGNIMGDDTINADQTKYASSHTVILNGLIPGTKYSYQVLSVDASGNIGLGGTGTFTTASQSALSSISLTSTVLGEATVTWITKDKMTSLVEYGTTEKYGQKNESTSSATEHTIAIKGLTLGQLYHFRVQSKDSLGNIYVSGDYLFQPKSPPVISGIAIKDVTENGVTVTFSTNIPSDANVAYSAVGNAKKSGSQGSTDLVLNHEVVLQHLDPGTTYALEVQAKDEGGNAAKLAGPNFTTGKDETAPIVENIHTDSALSQTDRVQTIISWTTNEAASSSVVYTEGKNGEEITVAENSLVYNHSSVITSFKPGTVYYFKVKSLDKSGNEGVSTDYALLTPRKKENIIEVIVNNFQDIFKWASK